MKFSQPILPYCEVCKKPMKVVKLTHKKIKITMFFFICDCTEKFKKENIYDFELNM